MPKRVLQGRVVSNAADKTIVVSVERRIKHPVFKKFVRKSKRFKAHDENNVANVGDLVRIRECAPISKHKSWELVSNGNGASSEAAS